MRRDLQQLKNVTRCKNCGELGHWHKECPQKNQSHGKIPQGSQGAASASASHSWWSLVQPVSDTNASDAADPSDALQACQE